MIDRFIRKKKPFAILRHTARIAGSTLERINNKINMRKLNNYEAVKVNSEEEATEFLQYLKDNTNLEWYTGGKITGLEMEKTISRESPFFFEVFRDKLLISSINSLEDETKIIPLTEFLKPKVTYTREQAEKVFEDYRLFHNNTWFLTKQEVIEFLDHKFSKSTLEQVTEAVKDLGNFKIEQTISGSIIISPINNK